MRILLYTRLENDTGGDEALLNILQSYLLQNLEKDTEVHLCLSYDIASEARAEKIEAKWIKNLEDRELKGQVWRFLTAESSFEKSVTGVKCRYISSKNITGNSLNTLDGTVTWYIKYQDKYYLYKKGNGGALELTLNENENVPNLKQRNCYISEQKSECEDNYPLYVLKDRSIDYYRSVESKPKKFSLETAPRSLVQLRTKVKKGISSLSNDELRIINSFTCYMPTELLMTKKEYNLVEDHFVQIPENLSEDKARWQDFTELTRNLDVFVMAGWAHAQKPITAQYLKTALEIPQDCKVVLSCVPGMSINVNGFVTALQERQKYRYVYALQPGVRAKGGFPILPALTKHSIKDPKVREKWKLHIGEDYESNMHDTGKTGQDKLIVIYCSKDAPDGHGEAFLENIAKKIELGSRKDYPVLLIGAIPGSIECKRWKKACALREFPCSIIPRTESTQILMRGLRDARYSMATGSYSILEARYLEINHCKYLCPPHMAALGDMLENAKEDAVQQAFQQGQAALEELSRLPMDGYDAELLCPDSAWDKKDSWMNYLEEAFVGMSEGQEPSTTMTTTVQKYL
ncbi:hypothetical protein [Legionella tunisiensis]|uniref:hypothetical protein n=1 Tax=Legionella tunisiensis TaxID=1034944 RepID=UPI0002F6547D|nr:hypothetical protein [Legionella tunisiensis]